jgi:hypothetical protein
MAKLHYLFVKSRFITANDIFNLLSEFLYLNGFPLTLYDFVTLAKKISVMIRHIVFFRLAATQSGESGSLLLAEVKARLEKLPALIPQIRKMEIGINVAEDSKAAHLSLLSEFSDWGSLQKYQEHPDHRAFIEWNRDKCPKYSVVDYEF